VQRDNCPQCEGTGQRIDFAALRKLYQPLPGRAPTYRDNAPGWALRQDVTYPHWVRAWESQDGARRYIYQAKVIQGGYDVSYSRGDGDFDIRYRAAGGTGGYVGQAKTREGAFRMAARHANRAGLRAITRSNPKRRPRRIRQSMRVVARGVEMDIRRAFGKLPISTAAGAKRKRKPRLSRNPALHSVKVVGSNMTEADHGSVYILYSYETPVAIRPREGVGSKPLVTDYFHSRTTSKHIGSWLRTHGYTIKDAERLPQDMIEAIAKRGYYAKPNPRRTRRNPLAIYGATNPPRGSSGVTRVVKVLGRVVEIRYKRQDDGGFYYHRFQKRPRLLALSDGALAVRP